VNATPAILRHLTKEWQSLHTIRHKACDPNGRLGLAMEARRLAAEGVAEVRGGFTNGEGHYSPTGDEWHGTFMVRLKA